MPLSQHQLLYSAAVSSRLEPVILTTGVMSSCTTTVRVASQSVADKAHNLLSCRAYADATAESYGATLLAPSSWPYRQHATVLLATHSQCSGI